MLAIIFIFIVSIIVNVKNSNDLQALAKTSSISYELSNAFLNLYNNSLTFKVEQKAVELHYESFTSGKKNFETVLDKFNNAPGKRLLNIEFQERWDNINKLWNHTEKSLDTIINALDGMDNKPIAFLFDTRSFNEIMSDTSLFLKSEKYRSDYTSVRAIDTALVSMGSTSDILTTALQHTRDNLGAVVEEKEKINGYIVLISTLISTLFALLFAGIFSRSISNKIGKLKKILHQISTKNLAVEIDLNSKDEFNELGQYTKELITSLQGFIKTAGDSVDKVMESKDVINDGTRESAKSLNSINNSINEITSRFSTLDKNIETSSLDISNMDDEVVKIVNNINAQSEAVASSSSAIEEMTASVSQIANLTSKKQESTNGLLKVVATGGVSVENTLENIQKVNSEIDLVKGLVEVIKNVADQTNILSMNAAIESAHAGDAGKGFSVVADEIRSLAEYTSNNVEAINSAIKSISLKIESSLKASEESSVVFEQINRDVNDFSSAMAEISSSIEELAAGNSEILNSTNRVSSLNSEVYEGAGKIKEQSGMIESSMHSIQSVSRDVNETIQGISRGTNSVLESFSGINDISEESGEQIKDLFKRMNEYNLES